MLHTVNCSAPSAASGVVIEPYSNTTEGAVIYYNCDRSQGLCGNGRSSSVCLRSGLWTPDPNKLVCTQSELDKWIWFGLSITIQTDMCGPLQPPVNGRVDRGSQVTFQCNEGFLPLGEFTTTCLCNESWSPDPAQLECTPQPCEYMDSHCFHDVNYNHTCIC